MEEEKKEPTKKIPLGRIQVAIWENQTETGEIRFNVQVSRIYKNEDTNEWRNSHTFRRDDLPIVRAGMDLAYDWCWRRLLKAAASDKSNEKEKLN